MTAGLIVGWLLGVGCMLLREHYAERRHRETIRTVRARVLADAAASRPRPKVLAVSSHLVSTDKEAASHAASRDRRDPSLET